MIAPRRALALVAAALVAAAAVIVAPAPVLRAADDSDIPGVALPGPLVTGTLGGPVYDHVYRLDVPPGNVIFASMTGAAGTDFDLYLFDSTAKTVWANPPVGLVAQSTGPTSTESIAYATPAGGTFYLDLHGFSETQGAFRLSVTIQPDITPPTVTLRIQGGAPAVSSPTVTLTIVAADDLSGVDKMQFSTDGTAWLPWQPYSPSLLWTFPEGDGVKQLWVRVRDRAGNVSTTATAQTVLDTVAPTVVSVSPARDSVVAGLRPIVRVVFSKPMTPVWWLNAGLFVRPLGGGALVPGTYGYDGTTRTGTFQPSVDLLAGAAYEATFNTLYDIAGNPLASYPLWTFTPKIAIPLTLVLSPSTIVSGGTAAAIGTARVPGPTAIQLQERRAGAADWTTISAPFPDAAGAIRETVSPDVNAQYRLHVDGSPTTAEATSPTTSLAVRFRVTLLGLVSSAPMNARTGVVQQLQAHLDPGTPGVVATFTLYRYDVTKRAWVKFVAAKRTTGASGIATYAWRHRTGRWYLRVVTAQTAANAAGISSTYGWDVK